MLARSRGFAIHYEVSGTGPPLVLVPGTVSSAAQWELFGYVRALAATFRVVRVDPLGHGHSDTPHDPDAYTAAGVTEDLVAVLDAEEIEQAIVWGYSRGGWIAYLLAAAHPDRVAKLVIGGFASHAHEAELARQSAWIEYLSRADWARFWATFEIDDPRALKPIEDSNDPLAIAAAVAGSQRPTRHVPLAAINCPSLHYVGGADLIVPHVRADARALDAPLEVLAGATHLSAFGEATPALEFVRPRLAAEV